MPSFYDVISAAVLYEVQPTGMQEQRQSMNIFGQDNQEREWDACRASPLLEADVHDSRDLKKGKAIPVTGREGP
jgi:hypothetical protein